MKRRQDIIRGQTLNYPAAVASRYGAKLQRAIRTMTRETNYEIRKLFMTDPAQEYFGQDASIASMARILTNKLMAKFDQFFADIAKNAAETMVNEANTASAASVGMSIRSMSEGLVLNQASIFKADPDIITASVAENVALIKSIPGQYLNAIQGAVMRSISTGNGMADLVPFMAKHHRISMKRAELIAHDQTRKATSALNKARMVNAGVKKFEWIHSSGGQHPRPLHLDVLNGNIYSFDDPPIIDDRTGERGLPGQLINCRCRMSPIIDFSGDE